MPSTFKHPAHVPMWRGAKVAYFFIAMCLFPIAIGGFWAYGNLVSNLTLHFIDCKFPSIRDLKAEGKHDFFHSFDMVWLNCHSIFYYVNLLLIALLSLDLDAFRRDSQCTLCISHSRHSKRTSCPDFSSCCIQLSELFSNIFDASF